VVLAAGKHSRFYFPEFLLARPRDSTFEEFERGRALISSWSVEGMSALPPKADIERGVMSALCQKRTFCAAVKNRLIRSPRRRGRAAMAAR